MPQNVPPSADGSGDVPRRYEGLHRFLCAPHPPVIELSFIEIHRLGSNLPHRARTEEDWWSNHPDGDPQRMTWLAAGRRVQAVDVERSRVWFALTIARQPGTTRPSTSGASADGAGLRSPADLPNAPPPWCGPGSFSVGPSDDGQVAERRQA